MTDKKAAKAAPAKKVKVGKEKALPKDHKKVPDKDVMGDPPEEKKGEEEVAEEAIVEVASIKVRGTSVGGTCMMTPSEHKKYLKSVAKKK